MTQEQTTSSNITFTIRNVPSEIAEKLDTLARAQGMSRESWLRELVIRTSHTPVVQEKYTLKVYGVSGKGKIIKRNDEPVNSGFSNFNRVEAEAFEKALDYVQRNTLGDREKAIALLQDTFEEVFLEG